MGEIGYKVQDLGYKVRYFKVQRRHAICWSFWIL